MTDTLLLTGFGSFGREKINPSGIAARQLDGKRILRAKIVGVELPVAFEEAGRLLQQSIKSTKPLAVISTGVAAGRPELSVERVAINVMDAPRGDTEGRKPIDEPIVKAGSPAYFSTLPMRAIVKDLEKAGIPAVVSNTAGTHLCNYAMYVGLHYVTTHKLGIPAGFIHVPQTPDQTIRRRGMPSMSFETIVKGLEIAARRTIISATR